MRTKDITPSPPPYVFPSANRRQRLSRPNAVSGRACVYSATASLHNIMVKQKPLTAAERQRICRAKRNNDPEKVAEVKRKDLERYHARKKLVADMSEREHRIQKRRWQEANRKRREKKKILEEVLLNTPAPSPIPESPRVTPCATPTLSEVSMRSSSGKKK
nr:uncharacterized protein LOC128676866 [Plodia interpunctella]